MEPEGSLPRLQVPATFPYSKPDQSSPCSYHPTSWRSILILSFHLRHQSIFGGYCVTSLQKRLVCGWNTICDFFGNWVSNIKVKFHLWVASQPVFDWGPVFMGEIELRLRVTLQIRFRILQYRLGKTRRIKAWILCPPIQVNGSLLVMW
jgi:hypothetical protein